MAKEKVEKTYKTHQIVVKKGHRMFSYFQLTCQNAKNMYNTTNFYIRQVYTSLTQTKPIQPLQQEVLDTIRNNIDKMNNVQLDAYKKKLEKEKLKPVEERKEVKANLFSVPTKENPYVDYNFLDSLFKACGQNDYRSLPTQSSQWVMKSCFQNWKSFFASLQEWKVNPSKFTGKPKIPGYCRSEEKEIQFTNQDCVIKNDKFLKFPKTKLQLNIGKLGLQINKLNQIRVIPKYGSYTVELVEEMQEKQITSTSENILSIDLGIDNLATITTNTGRNPILVKGKHVKSINQYYNKMKAHYLGILRHGKQTNEGPFTSTRLEKLHENRHRKIKDIFHKVSHFIVKISLEENVGTIVIGQNKGWKNEINIGKRNNQSIVHIPHSLLIQMITYKAKRYGIEVIVSEESYTSKASYWDNDDIPTYSESDTKKSFSGRRISRGLYKTKLGFVINADVNGSANILKKTVMKLRKMDSFNIETINVWNPTVYVA